MNFSDWVQKWINQFAHIGWGAYFMLLLLGHMRFGWAFIITTVFASAKEGIFDPITETKAEQGSGWEDWAFWMLGFALGAGSHWL